MKSSLMPQNMIYVDCPIANRASVYDDAIGSSGDISPCYICHNESGCKMRCSGHCAALKKYSSGEHYTQEDILPPSELERLNEDARELSRNRTLRLELYRKQRFFPTVSACKKRVFPTVRRASQKAEAMGYSSLCQAISRLYESGVNFTAISKMFQIGEPTTVDIYRKANPGTPTARELQIIRKKKLSARAWLMRNRGLTRKEISAKLGVSIPTIDKYIYERKNDGCI